MAEEVEIFGLAYRLPKDGVWPRGDVLFQVRADSSTEDLQAALYCLDTQLQRMNSRNVDDLLASPLRRPSESEEAILHKHELAWERDEDTRPNLLEFRAKVVDELRSRGIVCK